MLAKLRHSKVLEPIWRVGTDPNSDGLKRAKAMGFKTTAEGVDVFKTQDVAEDLVAPIMGFTIRIDRDALTLGHAGVSAARKTRSGTRS